MMARRENKDYRQATLGTVVVSIVIGWIIVGALPMNLWARSGHLEGPEAAEQMRKDDAMFELLIESYLQLETGLIEAEYQHQLQVADAITDFEKRHRLMKLSRKTRDLRLARLAEKIGQMIQGYELARVHGTGGTGAVVPIKSDRAAAQARLKSLKAFYPDMLNRRE